MNRTEYGRQCTQVNRKVQGVLQQLIAHRGDPKMAQRLQPHASECLNEVFELRRLAGQHDYPLGLLDESARMLTRHFPKLLVTDEEWLEF